MPNCYYHSRKEADYCCNQCRRDICAACAIVVEGEPFCQICWDGCIAHLRNLQQIKDEYKREIPWQRWRELGPVKAFMETAGQVVFQPRFFFSHLPSGQELAAPLLFAVICILLFWFPMNVIYIKFIFPSVLHSLSMEEPALTGAESAPLPGNDASNPPDIQQAMRQRIGSITGMEILTMPVNFILFNIFIASLLQQVLVSFFQGRQGFAATFQIRCYSMIAQSFLLIPFLGILLAEIGSLFVCMRGFQIVQKLTFTQALCVALVPIMITFLALPSLL